MSLRYKTYRKTGRGEPMKIILAGYGMWGMECLMALCEKKAYTVQAVFVEKDKKRENKMIEEAAKKYKLKMYKGKVDEKHIQKYKPDLLVNVGFHQIYKNNILSKVKGINIHMGDLPDYKGRSVLNHAVINGEPYVGVTVHWMTEDIDAGPIVQQQHIPVESNDTAATLLEKTLQWYPRLLLLAIEKIGGKQRYFRQRKPEDSEIKPEQLQSVRVLHNFIRALTDPFPNAFIHVGSRRLIFKESKMNLQEGHQELWARLDVR